MKEPRNILVFQTAFLGDVILTLPMLQVLKKHFPFSEIDVVTTPKAAELLKNHPAISNVLLYDKRGAQRGLRGILELSSFLRKQRYDIALVPHRSFRTAAVIGLSNIPVRVGLSIAAGKFFYTHIVEYQKSRHEIERNYALLAPFGIKVMLRELPSLHPSLNDTNTVNKFLFEREIIHQQKMIAIAPGSVWNTKRWLIERYTGLALRLAEEGWEVLLIGGKEDMELGKAIIESAKHKNIHNAAGALSLLQSAELIGRCKTLVTNDSAPLHIGVAMQTPVVAIFGATVPEFGFAPYGKHDVVVEIKNLSCRPCAIHGGNECPIGTFDCMKKIDVEMVYEKIVEHLVKVPRE